jgi:hypothetical protein
MAISGRLLNQIDSRTIIRIIKGAPFKILHIAIIQDLGVCSLIFQKLIM